MLPVLPVSFTPDCCTLATVAARIVIVLVSWAAPVFGLVTDGSMLLEGK